uniref:Putative fmrfamide-related neuropeptide-like protein n=1 Tax=Amblyomma aureolatum TaxID=187763 RepID=A0A1E1WXS9_9ACAR
MQSWRAVLTLCTLLLLAVMTNMACAAYRKPPFNGSIFGKRSRGDLNNADIKYAMCEAVWDTCSQWFPISQDGAQ